MTERTMALWFPDWSVTALQRAGEAEGDDRPVAVIVGGVVEMCSASARRVGVRRGQRRRDAQARCPGLRVVPGDSVRDHREFAPLVARLEELAPGVQILRPGLCLVRARGPARYYGGEVAAACALLDALYDLGVPGVRAGVADGPFAAELAARTGTSADEVVRVVPPEKSGEFLAPLPATFLGDDEAASLLARLGVHTLGDVARLSAERMRERFGARGDRWWALAAGADGRSVEPRTPPARLEREVAFEPPLEVAEQIAFAMRVAAEEFLRDIDAEALVCTEVRIVLTGERGERSERVWLHPASFDAGAVVDRIRWQLAEERGSGLRSAVALVRLEPEAVDAASHHRPALFGGGPEEKVHHALSRVQAMLGHRGVLVSRVGGGRWLGERQVLVPWGDRETVGTERSRPWPGHLAAPLPTTVFPHPLPLRVESAEGAIVRVDERGQISGVPSVLADGPRRLGIVAWAGPWPLVERVWDDVRRRVAHRFQVVDREQTAWLLIWENDRWLAEARYD